jgi:hypothetical protein
VVGDRIVATATLDMSTGGITNHDAMSQAVGEGSISAHHVAGPVRIRRYVARRTLPGGAGLAMPTVFLSCG